METSKKIDQLIATILTESESIYSLISLYLDDDTSREQRADICARLEPIRREIRYYKLQERSLDERIRIYLAKLSMFDDSEDKDLDFRDVSVGYNQFFTTVVDAAIRTKIPVLQIIQDISAISSPQGKRRIASFEEAYRDRRNTVQKQEAQRWRQEKSGQEPAPKSPPRKRKSRSEFQLFKTRDKNLDLPPRHWISPRLRFGFTAIFIGVMAIIVISEGEDPRSVIFLSTILLAIIALLSWTYYNRDWGK